MLINLGSGHTRVHHEIARDPNSSTTRSLGGSVTVYRSIVESARRKLFDKEVDELLTARSILEEIIADLYKDEFE